MKPLRYDADAERELSATAEWYDKQRQGLGLDFLEEVRRARRRLQERPSGYARIAGIQTELGVHSVSLRRFPYALVFVELRDELRILAVVHFRRRPGYWKKRLPRSE